MELDDLVKGLLAEVSRVAKSDAVVGQVRDAGDAKVLPLSKVSIGFGAAIVGLDGKAKRDALKGDAGIEGGGVGGALTVEPKAFVVVGQDGVPHMLALKRGKKAVVRRGLEILPRGESAALLGGAAKALTAGESDDE
ncbi:MAG: hypothetical protein H6718_34355 [Polyangiaceae bacterium]|nr:hypothetical protein [Myxococcales bacterium]MCB9590543.1 hypothetical protein [Polyangiaceae bacterium]MCB9608538.1 hypothetical protein [Polyangiaceae bacterium]